MPVLFDDVLWAYRLLLGREPENAAVLALHAETADRAALCRDFMASDEFRSRSSDQLTIGRFLHAPPSAVEIRCSDEELERMLDGVAREWTGFGERDPHWSVLVDDRYLSDAIGAHEDAFYASGAPDIAQVIDMVRRNRPAARLDRALDFGCGVGRLSLALAERVGHVTGVDISRPHLDVARARATAVGRDNTDFRQVRSPRDTDALDEYDLIISLIVLQHNPPPVMAQLLAALLRRLATGGLMVFQIPTAIPGYRFSIADYLANQQPAMEMNMLPQADLFRIVEEAGCRPLEVREDGRIGADGLSHTFLVERRA